MKRQREGKQLTESIEMPQAVIEANNMNNNIKQQVVTITGQGVKSCR